MWSNFAWPEHIVRDSSAVFIFVTPQQFLKDIQICLENLSIFDPEKDYPLTDASNPDHCSICLIYVWTPQSYIPVHSDGKHRKTVTIYCNESWSSERGGLLQWIDSETKTWQELVPTTGTVVFNDKDEVHTTTRVQGEGNFRVSLQIFLLSSQQPASATYD